MRKLDPKFRIGREASCNSAKDKKYFFLCFFMKKKSKGIMQNFHS